jgi:hypothetical protein
VHVVENINGGSERPLTGRPQVIAICAIAADGATGP